MNYTLSFRENGFSLSETSVLPRELLTYGFPFCTNEDLKISPFIPTLGHVDSRSLTVTVRLEEGLFIMMAMFSCDNYSFTQVLNLLKE